MLRICFTSASCCFKVVSELTQESSATQHPSFDCQPQRQSCQTPNRTLTGETRTSKRPPQDRNEVWRLLFDAHPGANIRYFSARTPRVPTCDLDALGGHAALLSPRFPRPFLGVGVERQAALPPRALAPGGLCMSAPTPAPRPPSLPQPQSDRDPRAFAHLRCASQPGTTRNPYPGKGQPFAGHETDDDDGSAKESPQAAATGSERALRAPVYGRCCPAAGRPTGQLPPGHALQVVRPPFNLVHCPSRRGVGVRAQPGAVASWECSSCRPWAHARQERQPQHVEATKVAGGVPGTMSQQNIHYRGTSGAGYYQSPQQQPPPQGNSVSQYPPQPAAYR
eukprot:scaffold1667_cov411-Prasinococcus_capsulatus_cf.AAC.12